VSCNKLHYLPGIILHQSNSVGFYRHVLLQKLSQFVYSEANFNYDVSWDQFNCNPQLSRVSEFVLLTTLYINYYETIRHDSTHASGSILG